MIFTTGTLTACSGGSHLTMPVTINAVTRDLVLSREDVFAAAPEGFEEIRAAVVARLRSAVLEATTGNPTPVQIRNAVSDKTFEV